MHGTRPVWLNRSDLDGRLRPWHQDRVTESTTTTAFLEAGGKVYVKRFGDILLVAHSIVLFSLRRLLFTYYAFPVLARRYGIRESGYAVVYFAVFGVWGIYNMLTTRTKFQIKYVWRDYPHTQLSGTMKRYHYWLHYWLQQFLVLILGPEKRRTTRAFRSGDRELVIHHVITVWMVSCSYLMYIALLGNAVFVNMDVPDVLLASKFLNYFQLECAKVVLLAVFVVGWTTTALLPLPDRVLVPRADLRAREEDIGALEARNSPRYHGVDGQVHICVFAFFFSGETSYLMPVTLFGNAAFVSVDVPEGLALFCPPIRFSVLAPYVGHPSAWLWYPIDEIRSCEDSEDSAVLPYCRNSAVFRVIEGPLSSATT
ncbi:hypothetical protein DFH08DRAFT_819882 [Mycena albidolilacea]|uniref:TLC domain-containing protein n=1 Tax=Mycena albidolilacea TaxID=1033008 RepID=A0AAD6ZE47_9AGAR|nr:hypothetical protein DFH08DRAFT_819882 [Mycena albidolilacea]